MSVPHFGIVIASHGANVQVEVSGQVHHCTVRRKVGSVTCGDHVGIELPACGDGVVVSVDIRRNEMARRAEHGKAKLLAANIDQMLIVTESSVTPEFTGDGENDTLQLDRYLVAAEAANAAAVILINKGDLFTSDQIDRLRQRLRRYHDLAYPMLITSARLGQGLEPLRQLLIGKVSVIVGQSGAGKSSLVNALVPDAATATGDLSRLTGQGRHTTTVARLYHVPTGGDLIDSPGVREFQPNFTDVKRIAEGFREFRPFLGQCRFNDCTHQNEPECAITHAAAVGLIHPQRRLNYGLIVAQIPPSTPGPAKIVSSRRR